MDRELKESIDKALADAIKALDEKDRFKYEELDPVVKMMLVTLVGEMKKIDDSVKNAAEQIADHFCTDFIPWEEMQAMPAITLIQPMFKPAASSEMVRIDNEDKQLVFTLKPASAKKAMRYIPVFSTNAMPYQHLTVYTWRGVVMDDDDEPKQDAIDGNMEKNIILVGITTDCEVECMEDLTFAIEGLDQLPESILVGPGLSTPIEYTTIKDFEELKTTYPFDPQQFSKRQVALVREWRKLMMRKGMPRQIFVTDQKIDIDLFKPNPLPKGYHRLLEQEVQNIINPKKTIWMKIKYSENTVIPENCKVRMNTFPVVNVGINTLTLSANEPIKSVEGKDGEYFIGLIETTKKEHEKGFGASEEEIIVRDYDASCYDNAALERDIRNLFYRFKDDYWAFADYNNFRNGEGLKRLRQSIVELQKDKEGNKPKNEYDAGTYVMKIWDRATSAVEVTYITTNGHNGNAAQKGNIMDSKNLPAALEQKTLVVMDAIGGEDKRSDKKAVNEKARKASDDRCEYLRYYTLTNDRLYTKMDIDAFLRKEIMARFGKAKASRIGIDIRIEGVGGEHQLQRGLYVNICFKDRNTYEKAVEIDFDKKMLQGIIDRSCIAMPIFVNPVNLEE